MGRVPPTIVASNTAAVRMWPRRLAGTTSPEAAITVGPFISILRWHSLEPERLHGVMVHGGGLPCGNLGR